MDIKFVFSTPPPLDLALPIAPTKVPINMLSRNSLGPEASTIVVNWHSVGSICPSRWSMLSDRWRTVNDGCITHLKAMINDAFAFRAIVDKHASYPDKSTHTRAAADALKALLINPLFHTLHTEIFNYDVKHSPRKKVTDWIAKRLNELVPIIEDFTTQVGRPSASLASFTVHGYSDEFLAARVRFLAAYERVYTSAHFLSGKQRKIRVPKPLFAAFENLQHQYHQQQGWIVKNPDAEEGEDLKHCSFAISHWEDWMTRKPNLDMTSESEQLDMAKGSWKEMWSVRRKYNWWIPLASSDPEVRHAHDMMVSHGITLFCAVQAHGKGPIEINDVTKHIEHTNNLCISQIEQYWLLAQQAILELKEWPEWKRLKQRQQQLEYVQCNMAICEQIASDLRKARLLSPDRVTRGSKKSSMEIINA